MKVRCTGCGKHSSFPDSDAGLLAFCPACGQSFRIPQAPAPEPSPSTPEVAPAAPAPSARSSNWLTIALWIGVGMIACCTGLGVWWNIHSTDQAREAQTVARAESLKEQTELLISVNAIDQAEAKFGELESFVVDSGRPDLRRLSDAVRADLTAKRKALVSANQPSRVDTKPSAVAEAQPREVSEYPGQSSSESAPRKIPQPRKQPPVPDIPASLKEPNAPTAESRPPVRKIEPAPDVLTDEKIGAAITRGIDQLLGLFDARTHLIRDTGVRDSPALGLDILCVYALMQAQQATNDPRLNPHDPLMIGMIEAMKRLKPDNYRWETYARGLRSTALALYDRPEDTAIMKEDAIALMHGSHAGGYTYELAKIGPGRNNKPDGTFDNSNSQYGLLGVWSAAEVGVEVPYVYWNMVQKHWMDTQTANGQWSYTDRNDGGTHSMTCAGLASLFVTHDYLDVPRFGTDVGRDPFTPTLSKGLNWLEHGNDAVDLSHGAYDLYGLERVGLASGFKFFGRHEWYRELATQTIANGAGGGDPVETAYSLLFLARGRHPVLMNKVRFDGFWANRPRDVANLARFAGYQLERPLNWQVVPIERSWTDWMDSPILYLSSHKPIPLSKDDYGKIRSYVENGGLLFMQADGGAKAFDRFAHEAAHTLFPDYEMTALPASHPLRTVMFKTMPSGNLFMVTNGSRILMLYSSEDLSKSWQLRDNKNRPFPFEFGTNLFIYAAGKRDLRNHLNSTYIPAVQESPTAAYTVARLKYTGNWNPEPAAWERFSRWFQINTGYGLKVVDVPINELKPETAIVAHLTGTARYDLTSSESAAIKNYVEAGGVLLVDLCGGTGTFDQGLQSSLYFKVFAKTPSQVISPSHPLLASAGGNGMDDLAKPILRQYAIDQLGAHAGLPEEITAGKGHVIFTSLDITSGLLGTNTWGITGYEPSYAESLTKNVILWTVDGQHDQPPVANR